ncbi:MAG: LuxR C-terminal-related transcriptional regulator [Mucilaginibacter sp.]|uniref:response regulator transcription factor n=1 Tax=Mucilaginibacter sp. TaxID=1882438 RepID=UPI003264D356
MAYHWGRYYAVRHSWKKWPPLIVLSLLLSWNVFFGYSCDFFVLVNVNTIALMVAVILMLTSFFYRKTDTEDLPDGVIDLEPSDRFIENCRKFMLSPRELEVVLLSRKGLKNKRIAEELFISERTVEGHLRNIYDKVGCDRSKLVLINRLNG